MKNKERQTISVKKWLITSVAMMISVSFSAQENDLKFNPEKFEIQEIKVGEKSFKVRAYENIIYVKNPVNTQYQTMNIYIPTEYFEGKNINGFSAETAPIFFPNKVGGYMPAKAGKPEKSDRTGKEGSIMIALSKGFVVASAGARGRTSATGKAPAVIVDLKAAVRYLKFNDKIMAGNAQKIISNGTSAGGAVSALLGASGDSPLYEKYLKELGAAQGSDAIFAVSAYCPITNLEHADSAYEWQFLGIDDYKKISIEMLDYQVQRKEVAGTLTADEKSVSKELAKTFPKYLNSLKLKDEHGKHLKLDKNGKGNFVNFIKKIVIQSAEKAQKKGTDLSGYSFLKIKNGKIEDLDFQQYLNYIGRQKTPPAFDGLDLSTGENQLFGDTKTDKKHFTAYSFKKSKKEGEKADENIIKIMNPMNFIGGKNGAKPPKHWRIRHGSKDRDTSLAVPVILAAALQNAGYQVDFALPWDIGHSGDYDLEEFFQWAKQIVQ